MKVRFPCLAVLVSLVFMYVDLYCLYPKSFLCLSGELLELLHGCAFLDHDNTLTDGGCFLLHILTSAFLVVLFDGGKSVGYAVGFP